MSFEGSVRKIVGALRKEEQRLVRELDVLRVKIGSLSGTTRARGRRKATRRRKMSAKGRAAISRAAKRRWAEWRKAKGRSA
jgi:hypothetical protein